MSEALRLQALTLPVGAVEPVDKFYRWVLGAKPAPDEEPAGVKPLSWGNEDRLRLVDAAAAEAPEEAVAVRLAARPFSSAADWLAGRGLVPVAATVPAEDADDATAAWPDARIMAADDDAAANRLVVSVRGPAEPRVDLVFPLPKEVLAPRNRMGPFYWKSRDWADLEVPGLLGVTTGAPDPDGFRDFLATIGVTPAEDAPEGPLAVGDHQWMLERREPGGIYGFAVVTGASRIKDLVRTLESLEAEFRHEKNRIVAADPAGRVVLIHGIHGA